MLRNLSLFSTSFMVALSGAMMPGPLLVMTITRVAEDGFLTAPMLMTGHALAEMVTVVLLVKGIGQFLKRPRIFSAIAILGAIFLMYMAWENFSSSGIPGQPDNPSADKHRLPDPVSGMVLSLTNPYWTMWWLTIGTTYLALAQRLGRTGIAAFYCGHILADIGWYCVVAFLVTAGVPFLSGNIYRGMMVSLGFVLGGIGIYFLVAGIRSLRTGSD